MIGRMFGSLLLRSATYEDVEHDKSAIWQAVFIVILVSAATVVGELLAGAETDIVEAVAARNNTRSGKLGCLGVVCLGGGGNRL